MCSVSPKQEPSSAALRRVALCNGQRLVQHVIRQRRQIMGTCHACCSPFCGLRSTAQAKRCASLHCTQLELCFEPNTADRCDFAVCMFRCCRNTAAPSPLSQAQAYGSSISKTSAAMKNVEASRTLNVRWDALYFFCVWRCVQHGCLCIYLSILAQTFRKL